MYTANVNGRIITIACSEGLFSPSAPDRGTLAMLSKVKIESGSRVLDLGCGAGLVGIYAALCAGDENVLLSDIDPAAVEAAKKNAYLNGVSPAFCVSDGFKAIDAAGFDIILSNPPYQSDFCVAKAFIEKGFNRLKIGGIMYMVTKRRTWYQNKLKSVFGGCRVYELDGYFVFEAQKRQSRYAKKNVHSIL